jgi:hypothetical protein
VTVDDISDISNSTHVAESLAALPERPIVRIVFDKDRSPADYADAIHTVRPVAQLLGTPVDSSDAKDYPLDQYVGRFHDYWSSGTGRRPGRARARR